METIKRLSMFGVFRLSLYACQGFLYLGKQVSRFFAHTFTHLEQGVKNYSRVCDYCMFGSLPHEYVQQSVTTSDMTAVDLVSAIAEKQVQIIGGTGEGKSTIAQYLAYQVGGKVTVYDCEGTPDSWRGLEAIGEGENWESIQQGMAWDLEDLTSQIQLRKDKGDAALAGSDRVLIAEEFPELNERVDVASEWLTRHARRGRKARRFIICLSQYDRVSAWGLEGKSDLEACFVKIRLGKIAIAHAKRLKNPVLEAWLRESRSHALADDLPCILPPYEDMRRATMSVPVAFLPATQPTREETPEAPPSLVSADSPGDLQGIISALNSGKSPDWVVKNLLGFTGGQGYRDHKPVVVAIANSLVGQSHDS